MEEKYKSAFLSASGALVALSIWVAVGDHVDVAILLALYALVALGAVNSK